MWFIIIVAPLVRSSLPRQSQRLAPNKHSSTVPEVTVVTVMLNKLPTAVESIGKRRSATERGFDLRLAFFADRFFAVMTKYL